MYVNRNIGISRCNSVINNMKLEILEDDTLSVETYSVTQINKSCCVDGEIYFIIITYVTGWKL
jgi:hypothetical protein